MTAKQRIRAAVIGVVLVVFGVVVVVRFEWALALRLLVAAPCWIVGGLCLLGAAVGRISLERPASPPADGFAPLDSLYDEADRSGWVPVTGASLGWYDAYNPEDPAAPIRRAVVALFCLDPQYRNDWRTLVQWQRRVRPISDGEEGTPYPHLSEEWNREFPYLSPPRYEVPPELTDGVPCFIGIVYIRDDAFGEDAAKYPTDETTMNWSLYPLLADPAPGDLARLTLDESRVEPDFPGRWQRRRAQWLREHGGVVTTAALVQAYHGLFDPQDPWDRMALVAFTLEEVPDRASFLQRVAAKASELKDTTPQDHELAEVAREVTDERSFIYHRYRLPRAFAEDREVYFAHLQVHRPYLPAGYLSGRVLRVIVEPGEQGAIEHLPPTDG